MGDAGRQRQRQQRRYANKRSDWNLDRRYNSERRHQSACHQSQQWDQRISYNILARRWNVGNPSDWSNRKRTDCQQRHQYHVDVGWKPNHRIAECGVDNGCMGWLAGRFPWRDWCSHTATKRGTVRQRHQRRAGSRGQCHRHEQISHASEFWCAGVEHDRLR